MLNYRFSLYIFSTCCRFSTVVRGEISATKVFLDFSDLMVFFGSLYQKSVSDMVPQVDAFLRMLQESGSLAGVLKERYLCIFLHESCKFLQDIARQSPVRFLARVCNSLVISVWFYGKISAEKMKR